MPAFEARELNAELIPWTRQADVEACDCGIIELLFQSGTVPMPSVADELTRAIYHADATFNQAPASPR